MDSNSKFIKFRNFGFPKSRNLFLNASGPTSQAFRKQKINHFSQAVDWIHQLSYGRNSNRANFMLIFKELCGTCSTKHAALAALAQENDIEAKLQMAICRLDVKLEPRANQLLEKIGAEFFPEAHCYLQVGFQNIDITFPDQSPYLRAEILENYTLLPSEIGDHKLKLHHAYLHKWLSTQPLCRQFSFEEIWQLREDWISSISNNYSP